MEIKGMAEEIKTEKVENCIVAKPLITCFKGGTSLSRFVILVCIVRSNGVNLKGRKNRNRSLMRNI